MEFRRKCTITSSLLLALVLASPSSALDLGLGGLGGVSVGIGGGGVGVDANVGGSSGVNASANVGLGHHSANVDVGASVGGSSGGGADVGVQVGGGTATSGTPGTPGIPGTPGSPTAPGVPTPTTDLQTAHSATPGIVLSNDLATLSGTMVMSADGKAIGYVDGAKMHDSGRILVQVLLVDGLASATPRAQILLSETPKARETIRLSMSLNRFLQKL